MQIKDRFEIYKLKTNFKFTNLQIEDTFQLYKLKTDFKIYKLLQIDISLHVAIALDCNADSLDLQRLAISVKEYN